MKETILIWVQNENSTEFDYMFVADKLLKEEDLEQIEIIRKIFFNNPNSKRIWKGKKYSQSSVFSVGENHIIAGVLLSTDSNNRRLPFMFYIPKNIDSPKKNIKENLKIIGKEIDDDLLKKLLKKTKPSKKKTLFIYGSFLLILIITIYKILK